MSSECANNEECICLVSSLVLLQEVFSLLPCHFSRPISLLFWILAVESNFELNFSTEKFNFFAFETLFETKVELKVELREDLILVVSCAVAPPRSRALIEFVWFLWFGVRR